MDDPIKYKIDKSGFDESDIVNLYQAVGWTVYTNDTDKLMRALNNSRDVITAWYEKKLVGLIRTVGDGETILYIQDILVLPQYQRNGIGSVLLKMVLDRYPDVRQIVLLTDDTSKSRAFYRAIGFALSSTLNLLSFVRIQS